MKRAKKIPRNIARNNKRYRKHNRKEQQAVAIYKRNRIIGHGLGLNVDLII